MPGETETPAERARNALRMFVARQLANARGSRKALPDWDGFEAHLRDVLVASEAKHLPPPLAGFTLSRVEVSRG